MVIVSEEMNIPGKEFAPITTATTPLSLDVDYFIDTHCQKVAPEEHSGIRLAFDFATRAHEGYFRKSGEPFIAHPIMAAIYGIDAGFTQPSFIKATLLHDVREDNASFVNAVADKWFRESQRVDISGFKDELRGQIEDDMLRIQFGWGTSGIVNALTKTKRMTNRGHLRKIKEGPDLTKPVKGVDRLHNLRTYPLNDKNRVRGKIQETLSFMTVFEQAAKDFQEPGEKLLWLIEQELQRLEAEAAGQTVFVL